MPDASESAGLDELVIATQNPGKIGEIRTMLVAVGVRVLGLDEVGGPYPEPPETGRTFEENAALKALAYASLTGRPCLADDSGLQVDALGGRPGVDSAWYAYGSEAEAKARPREVRDPANIQRLLAALDGVPAAQRTARFICCMALAVPSAADRGGAGRARSGEIVANTRGDFEGRIGVPPRVPRGANGFGYDPVFLVGPGFERSSAEFSPAEKNAVSHRARALSAMVEAVARLR